MTKHMTITVRKVISKKNLLLLNAILCLCYPFCYLLIVLPFGDESMTHTLFEDGVTALNILFLAILTLNINTIAVVYLQLLKRHKRFIRIVFTITMAVWILYTFLAYYFTLFIPGFISHFHHYIRDSFLSLDWSMFIIAVVFAAGLSILYREYYVQVKMKYLLYFIIPMIFYFAFKNMLPFIFNMMAWILFCGCQLLLYFSILDDNWHINNNIKYSHRRDTDALVAG